MYSCGLSQRYKALSLAAPRRLRSYLEVVKRPENCIAAIEVMITRNIIHTDIIFDNDYRVDDSTKSCVII
jgi:hypothetical protein